MARDPYQELGVTRTASADDIRKAFRKLAKQNHPDTNPGDKAAEERFKRVSAAFDIVGDAEKRKKFDAGEIDADGRETARGYTGGAGPWGRQPGGNPWGDAGPGRRGYQSESFEGADLGDILGEMFGGGRTGRAGGAGGGFGGFSQRGSDVRAKLEVDLLDAVRGGKRRIAFSDGRTIDVTIPKGAQDGQTLRLKGQGSPGRAGAGDAFIELRILPHPIFRREGEVLVMDLPVSVYDAVLGGKVEAPTPDGPVNVTVPKGSNTGTRLRLKGRGLADAKGVRGDLFARLVVTLPDVADPDLEAFAETWRQKRPYTPRRRT
ncbi:DnaJ C-terminal domain-containing protein [Phenylobacterium sp.]|uniref:DnaJ C-terminal domain-containing protein n=1 Tax=Phenylobacterium sp. TaxID=1871053 RepID=UPI003783947A